MSSRNAALAILVLCSLQPAPLEAQGRYEMEAEVVRLAAADSLLARGDARFEEYVAVENLVAHGAYFQYPDSSVLAASPGLQLRRIQLVEGAVGAWTLELGRSNPLVQAWMISRRSFLSWFESGAMWVVPPETYWGLFDRHSNTSWAEEIAWAAAQATAPADECYVDCMLDRIVRKWGRYWEEFPDGAHVQEAVARAAEAASLAARSCDPGQANPDATREAALRLAAGLAPVDVAGEEALVQTLRGIHDSCGEPALRGRGETAGTPLVVGLLRADCVALPFAAWSEGQWQRLDFWTAPETFRPWSDPWEYAIRTGAGGSLRTTDVVEFHTGGNSFYEGWGLGTDYPTCQASEGSSFPVERIGAIASPQGPLKPFMEATPGSSRYDALAAAVLPEFDVWEEGLPAPEADAGMAAARVDPSLRQVLTAEVGDSVLAYFVAERPRPAAADAIILPVALLQGWAVIRDGVATVRDFEIAVDNGIGVGPATWMPLATFSHFGRGLIIAERRLYEGTDKQMLLWGEDGVRPLLPEP